MTVSRLRVLLSVVGVGLVAAVALVLGHGLGGTHASASDADPAASHISPTPAPPLRGQALAGGTLDLARLRGHVVVVNMWASWCAPCREELPLLVDAARQYAGQGPGVRVLAVNVNDDRSRARAFLAKVRGTSLPTIFDPHGELAVGWGARGLPQTFVVDASGRIVARRDGEITGGWLHAAVAPLLRP